MAVRDPEILNRRERASLQLMKYDRWIDGNDLYPSGKGTIASPVKEGWIERRPIPSGSDQFRITPAGRTAVYARIR